MCFNWIDSSMEPKAVQAMPLGAAATCQWMNEMNAQNNTTSLSLFEVPR